MSSLARIVDSDLLPGAIFKAPGGMTITPIVYSVRVVWVDSKRDVIHYQKGGGSYCYHTSILRFLEIVNYRINY
jgi:hypothetical protein